MASRELQQLLVDGARALVEGRRDQARELLLSYVEQDENSEEAWLWLSGAVDELDDIEVALQNCLQMNPANQRAQQGMAWVNRQRGY